MIHSRQHWSLLAAISFAALVSCDSRPSGEPETREQADANSDFEKIAKLQGDVTFTLEDGEALNQANPDTFWIPPKERREDLVKGDIVKLVFNLTDGDQTQGERMWVIVKGRNGSGYTGILDNNPYSTDRIKAGYEVSFEPRHVIDIFEEESPNVEEAEQGGADQPATAPASKPEGDQNSKLELEARSQ
jgi:uncharacterized protein YegJ (DUF2314 family)